MASANDAGKPKRGRPRKVLEPGELPDRNYWPRHTERDQRLIATFLTTLILEAKNAEERSRQAMGKPPYAPGQEGTLAHWKATVKALAWVLSRVADRQAYLWVEQQQKAGKL
jgi:hypothetical protein